MINFWLCLGFFAQVLFSARFFVQWIASEKAGKSVVPVLFWYFSIMGSGLLLLYAIHRKDPVFILGQSAGIFIYPENATPGIRKSTTYIFMHGGLRLVEPTARRGGHRAFAPAMLVYSRNLYLIWREEQVSHAS